jgi:hypothetical protein
MQRTRMNKGARQTVVSLPLMVMCGCIQVSGGAAEFSWTLRTFEGESISRCDNAGIAQVQLCWRALASSDPDCAPGRFAQFECPIGHGATRFEITPGPTSLQIAPICQDGSVPVVGTFQVPPPVVRTVNEGRVTMLNAILIVARDRTNPLSNCQPAGCTCGDVAVAVRAPP